jgi:hypothetical protein
MFDSNESFQLKQEKGLSVVQEPPAEETLQQTEAAEVEPVDIPLAQESTASASSKEPADSFRELREKADRAARERDELLSIVKEFKQQNAPSQPSEPEDYDLNLKPDDLAEGKHLTKVQKEIKKLKDELNTYKKQSYESIVEAKLKSNYNDFDKVVNPDTIRSLSSIYPELAATLNSSADLYNKAVSAYTMIKKLGIYQEDIYMADKKKVQENAAKPKTLSSISPQQAESPLSKVNAFANGLTPELQKQLRREMEDARKAI